MLEKGFIDIACPRSISSNHVQSATLLPFSFRNMHFRAHGAASSNAFPHVVELLLVEWNDIVDTK